MTTRDSRLVVSVLFTLIASQPLSAQESESDRVRRLESTILKLEARVAELEARDDARESSDLSGHLEALVNERVTAWGEGALSVRWHNGLRMEDPDGPTKIRLGFRVQNDYGFFDGNEALSRTSLGNLEDGAEIRRARFKLFGSLNEHVDYRIFVDFADGETSFKPVYLDFVRLPLPFNLRVGKQTEPMGLERFTSTAHITFLERGLSGTLVPGRNTGLMLWNTAFDERLWWGAGGFRATNDAGNSEPSDDGKWSVTGRVAGRPWFDDEQQFLHVGASVSWRNPDGDRLRFRQRPDHHLTPFFVDTGSFDASSAVHAAFETAAVFGPFSVQAEFVQAWIDADDDVQFTSFYLAASLFLTGESRSYDSKKASFAAITPHHDFLSEDGLGALELAVRYGYLDLSDGPVQGGVLQAFTFGINWYLDRFTRITLNYTFADVDHRADGGGDAHLLSLRFQIDF